MRNRNDFLRVINDLSTSANTDIVPIIQPASRQGGYFGVTRTICCYINFLGLLFSGWDGSKKKDKSEKINFGTARQAKDYIRDVMGKVDKNYVTNGDLLYDLYRHGTVHIYAPKKMASKLDPDKTIEWLIYKGDRESWQHYENKAVKLRHLEVKGWATTNRFILPLSINIFYDDLIESMDLYGKMVLADISGKLLAKFSQVVEALDTDYDITAIDFWSKASK